MKLLDMKITGYLEELESDEASPGGGSVSALAGAEAAGLIIMVTDLTIGKMRYAAYQDICLEVKSSCTAVHNELKAAVDKDTESYLRLAQAYKMPKNTAALKAERKAAIAAVVMEATEVPFRTMELCVRGLKETEKLIGSSNPTASSEIGTAAANFMAGIKGAWLSIKSNLSAIDDEKKRNGFALRGRHLYEQGSEIEDRIFGSVLESIESEL